MAETKKTARRAVKQTDKTKTTQRTAQKSTKKTVSKKTSAPKVSTPVTPSTKLLGVQDLFKASWELFKQTFLSYLKLVGVGIGLFVLIGVVALILALPLLISSAGSASDLFSSPAPLEIAGIVLVIVWAIVSFVAVFAYLLLLPVAGVFIFDAKEKPSLGMLFKRSKPLLLPYLLVSIMVGFLATGGWVLLIVPGLLISLLFIFVSYVFVLEKKRGVAALKRSYQLVREHFWEVLLRVFIIQVVLFLGSFVLDSLAEHSDFFSFASFVFSVVAGWFAQSYMYLLYKQVSARVPSASVTSIKWVVIVAIIGWIVIVGLFLAITNGIMPLPELQQSVETT
jgi:hypothetical protein